MIAAAHTNFHELLLPVPSVRWSRRVFAAHGSHGRRPPRSVRQSHAAWNNSLLAGSLCPLRRVHRCRWPCYLRAVQWAVEAWQAEGLHNRTLELFVALAKTALKP